MILLSLDQSSSAAGFAVVDTSVSHCNAGGMEIAGKLLDHGTLYGKDPNPVKRVLEIANKIKRVTYEFPPQKIIIEGHTYSTMMSRQATEALATITFLCRHIAVELNLSDPLRIPTGTMKKTAGGFGRAGKSAIMLQVAHWWGIPLSSIRDDNHSDALGLALTYLLRGDEIERRTTDKKSVKQTRLKVK